MLAGENGILTYHVDDALEQINQAEYGAHYIIIYPDLDMLRELYSNYIHKQIEENNGIVLINPFYETTDSVRQVLSQGNPSLDISKHEELVDYELSLPTKYEDGIALKGFCLYHQKDFDKFSDEQKQKLIEHHGKALKII